MIKAKEGNVTVSGTPYEILADFACIAKAVRNSFEEQLDKKHVDILLDKCYNDSKLSEKELIRRLEVMQSLFEFYSN